MRVIKLGGSLLADHSLPGCLTRIAASHAPTLVVTGGGAFAEQVRVAQRQWAFNDSAAHRMAILAMHQTALLVNALRPAWQLFESCRALPLAAYPHNIAVWLPDIALLDAHTIPASWRVTSDSLAAWLAGKVCANELLLVKAARFSPTATPAELVAQGVLDQAFLAYWDAARYHTRVVNSHDFIDSTLV